MIEELPSAPCFYLSLLPAAGNEYSWTQSLCSCPLPMRPACQSHCPLTLFKSFWHSVIFLQQYYPCVQHPVMHIYTEYLYVLICWYVAQQKHNGALHASLAKSCRFVRSSSRPPTVACCRWNASAPCTLKPSCETKTTKFFAVVVLCLFEMTTGFAWARWRLLQVICISCLVETCGTRQLVGTGHRKVWMVLFFFCCLHLSAKDCLVMLLRLVFHLFDIRLLSCMRDCPGGWTFCFDVKERPDGTAVLTHVRVVRSGAGPEIVETAEAETVSAVSHSPAADVVDCTEPEERHPVHRNLLRLFHQPQQQMLDPNFWRQLVGDATQFLSIGNFWSGNEEHREMDLAASLRDINFTGFCRVQMPFNALQELAVAMERLQQNGFPPAASVAQILPKIF